MGIFPIQGGGLTQTHFFYVSPLLSYLGSLPAMEEVETVKIPNGSDEFRLGTIKWLFYENYRAFALLGQNVPELMGSGIAIELQLHSQLLFYLHYGLLRLSKQTISSNAKFRRKIRIHSFYRQQTG